MGGLPEDFESMLAKLIIKEARWSGYHDKIDLTCLNRPGNSGDSVYASIFTLLAVAIVAKNLARGRKCHYNVNSLHAEQ